MDNRETSRAIAIATLQEICARNVEAALERMTDDFTWKIMRRVQAGSIANDYTRDDVAKLTEISKATMPDGLAMTIIGTAAETDRVAIETESFGRFVDGRVYSNIYHFLFEIRDGKVSAIREYMDTSYAAEMFQT